MAAGDGAPARSAPARGRTTSPETDPTRGDPVVRGGLLLLGFPHVVVGSWALAAPRHWHRTFPGGGLSWLTPHGPVQEHLARDFGAALLALGVLLVAAGVLRGRRLVRTALAAWLVFALPHLGFHAAVPAGLPPLERTANLTVLVLVAALPAWLWIRTRSSGKLGSAASTGPRAASAATHGDGDDDDGSGAGGRLPGARLPAAADGLTDLVARAGERELGREPAPTRLLGHHRPALLGATAYEMAVTRFDALAPGLRKLASLQAARIAGCFW